MSKVTDQIMSDAGYGKGELALDPAMVPERFQAALHPLMPTVGRIVHFYHEASDINPRAAIITSIVEYSEVGSPQIIASVDLSVFSGNGNSPVDVYRDVPAVMPGVKHDHEFWWQWPPRS